MQTNFEYQELLSRDPTAKWEALNKLLTQVQSCEKCPKLVYSRTLYEYGKPTFGFGNPNSPLFFVGEAPGRYGCGITGVPFTKDRSGEYFQKILREELGLTHKDIWITNVVKCCPEDNRTPHPEEIENCYPYLAEELNIIQPYVIVPLGFSAARAIFPKIERFGDVYGRDISLRDHTIRKVSISHFTIIYSVWHPAYIIRDPGREEKYRACFKAIEKCILYAIAVAQGEKSRKENGTR